MRKVILSIASLATCALAFAQPCLREDNIEEILRVLTVKEKVKLLVGGAQPIVLGSVPSVIVAEVPGASGNTRPIERLGIPATILADGPAGVRINPTRDGESRTYFATAFPVGVYYGDNIFYGHCAEEFREDLAASGLKARTVQCNVILLPEEVRRADMTRALLQWDKALEMMKTIGFDKVIVGALPFMPENAAQLDFAAKYLDAVGRKGKEAGLAFGYHNHDVEFNTVIEGNMLYDYLLDHTDSGLVFFELDTWWAVQAGADPAAYFRRPPPEDSAPCILKTSMPWEKAARWIFRPFFPRYLKAELTILS